MSTELSQLIDLECYVRLPGDVPCTKIQMSYQNLPATIKEFFHLKPEKQRIYANYCRRDVEEEKEKLI